MMELLEAVAVWMARAALAIGCIGMAVFGGMAIHRGQVDEAERHFTLAGVLWLCLTRSLQPWSME